LLYAQGQMPRTYTIQFNLLRSREDSLEVIYALSGLLRVEYPPSLNLCYTIDLLGIVGRYLEVFIVAMSVVSKTGDTAVVRSNFTRSGLKNFLSKDQQHPSMIQNALDKFIEIIKLSYAQYFFGIESSDDIRQLVPFLTAYSLFESFIQFLY
jgi:hypothetical protein